MNLGIRFAEALFFTVLVPLVTGIGGLQAIITTFLLIVFHSFMLQFFVIHWSLKKVWKTRNERIVVLVVSFLSAFFFQVVGLTQALSVVQTFAESNVDNAITHFSKWVTIYIVASALFIASSCARRSWKDHIWFFNFPGESPAFF